MPPTKNHWAPGEFHLESESRVVKMEVPIKAFASMKAGHREGLHPVSCSTFAIPKSEALFYLVVVGHSRLLGLD